jgi:hypothetical protein
MGTILKGWNYYRKNLFNLQNPEGVTYKNVTPFGVW